jgi:hypothetical protein
MKLKRSEWNALCMRVEELQKELDAVRRNTLMEISTGEVLINCIVPQILEHLKVKGVHGYYGLQPLDSPAQRETKP